MPTSVQRVVYLSKASRRMARGELADLLAGARQRNAEHGISGILLYDSGYFLQVLEGPPEAVSALLANIAADARHEGITVLSEGWVAERFFEGWAMDWFDLERYGDHRHAELRAHLRDQNSAERSAIYRALVAFLVDHQRDRPGAASQAWA